MTMQVQYIDSMGNDLSIINAAYASFGKRATEFDKEKHPKLLNYLARGMSESDFYQLIRDITLEVSDEKWVKQKLVEYRHTPTHWSPFSHATISLQIKAPIAIHAQCAKHTVGFAMNTVSRRYISEKPELFIPTFREKAKNVKQGSGSTHDGNKEWQAVYQEYCNNAIELYDKMISHEIAPEQARFVLPQGVMTEWTWTGSLYAWARFYLQRTDHHSQKEIQELAKMAGDIIKPLYPYSWQSLTAE